MPLANRPRRSPQTIRAAPESTLLAAEIESLGQEQLLARADDIEVCIAPAHLIPTVLQEIGRLRELTFRAAGEGTGKAVDLDHFDSAYLHLFAWNATKNEVVGAYRLAGTDQTRDLYTATLFKYGDAFLSRIGPALKEDSLRCWPFGRESEHISHAILDTAFCSALSASATNIKPCRGS